MTSLRFLGDLHPLVGLLIALALGGFAWWLYRREVFDLPRPYSWLLPTLRSLAIVLAILMLIGPTLHRREVEGELGKLQILIDASGSMAIADPAIDPDLTRSRFQRASELLLQGESPLLEKLAESHEVQVARFADLPTSIWNSSLRTESEVPTDWKLWKPTQWLGPTRIGTALAAIAGKPNSEAKVSNNISEPPAKANEEELNRSTLTLLFTDGRNNDGISPTDIAATLKNEKSPVFIIGMGTKQEPRDLAILSFDHPPQVSTRDTLRGKISLKDRAPEGTPLKLWIEHDGKRIWTQQVTSQNVDRRVIEFSTPVKPLIDSIAEDQGTTKNFAHPLALTAHVEAIDAEVDEANNELTSSLQVLKRRNRVLMIDGRSRWETRYLRNALERDPTWTLDAFLWENSQARTFLSSGEKKTFPESLDDWLEYDLVILGELPASAWTPSMQAGVRTLVENNGGGLILIDGDRGSLYDPSIETLSSLLPVRRKSGVRSDLKWKSTPTPSARTQNTFQLDDRGIPENDQTWIDLPEVVKMTPSELQPGAEELISLKSDNETFPMLVTRMSGAGRVLYSATDETWRWRYNVADTIHQKYWNQICRWVMKTPFAIEGEFLSLDTGVLVYRPGEPITIRARMRGSDGKPIQPTMVQAHIEPIDESTLEANATKANSSQAITIPLSLDSQGGSIYRSTVSDLRVGRYKVTIEASGLQADALQIESIIEVKAPADVESHLLSCNETLLKEIAEKSGGTYLHESKASELLQLLTPFQRGKIVESDILLWQSYYWFLPIILLLAMEWWLRKRAGLI